MSRVLSAIRKSPQSALYVALFVWFLPFFGLPVNLWVFLGITAVIIAIGLAAGTLTLAVLAVIMLFFPQNIVNGSGVYTFTLVLIAAAGLALAIYIRGLRGRFSLPPRRLLVSAACVAVCLGGWIAVGFANGVPTSQQVAVLRVIGLVLVTIFLLVGSRHIPSESFTQTINVVQVGGLLLSALIVFQNVTGSAPFIDQYSHSVAYTTAAFEGRVGGTIGHPISAGLVLVAIALLAATVRLRGWWAVAAVCLLASIPTGSRSAWVTAAIGGGVLAVQALRPKVGKRVFAISIASLLLLVGTALVLLTLAPVQDFLAANPLLSRLNVFADASGGYRMTRILRMWTLITDGPFAFLFGHGPGFANNYLQTVGIGDWQPDVFDQSYLSIWVDFGVVGMLAAFLPFVWIAIRRAGRIEGTLALTFLAAAAFVTVLNWDCTLAFAILTVTWATKGAPSELALIKRERAGRTSLGQRGEYAVE